MDSVFNRWKVSSPNIRSRSGSRISDHTHLPLPSPPSPAFSSVPIWMHLQRNIIVSTLYQRVILLRICEKIDCNFIHMGGSTDNCYLEQRPWTCYPGGWYEKLVSKNEASSSFSIFSEDIFRAPWVVLRLGERFILRSRSSLTVINISTIRWKKVSLRQRH